MSESNVEKAAEVIATHAPYRWDRSLRCEGCDGEFDVEEEWAAHVAAALADLLMPDGATEEQETIDLTPNDDEPTWVTLRRLVTPWEEVT